MKTKRSSINLICLLLLLSVFQFFPIKVNAATSLSSLIDQLPSGTYWNHKGTSYSTYNANRTTYNLKSTQTPCNHNEFGNVHCSYNGYNYSGQCGCNSFSGATQCMGFARFIGNQLSGNTPNGDGSAGNGWSATSISSLKIGDYIRYKRTSSHYGHSVIVVGVTSTDITVGECNYDSRCGISWTRHIAKSTLQGYYSTKCLTFGGIIPPDNDFVVDTRYKTPLTAYPAAESGKITVYNRNLTPYDINTRNIAAGDKCTINEVYTNGYCSVTYPISGGSHTEYAKLSDFIPNAVSHSSWTASSAIKTYTKSDMATSFGEIYVGDACITVGQSGSLQQVIYPVTGGYKLGWINSNYSPTPAPISYKDEEKNIGPVASGAFSGKTIIATALNDVDLGYDGSIQRKISKFDICIITNVDSSTALCTVEYPVNATDATNCSTTRTVSNISLNNFINYNGSAQAETTTIPEQLTAYPTYDMVNTVGSNTTNWWLDPGDTYTTINKIDGKSEVLYYCSQGRHAGKWKLGWVWLDYYSLDLNGYIDGALVGDLQKYGYADIYINGILRTKYANDFYSANGTFPRGSTYEIKNIAAYDGHTYNGVYSGSLKGTLTGNASCALNFTKDAATLYDIYVSQKPTKLEYLEGSTLNTSGLIVTATYSDGSTSDVTSSCTFSGFESNVPGVQTIDVKYQGKTASFTVKVEGKSPTTLSIESMPNKLKYRVGEEFSWEGLSVKASYNNGTSANVNNYDVIADDHLTDSTGIKTIIVAYCYNDIDVSTSFDIKVVEGKTPKITTDGIKTIAGELFSVPIKLSDNPGIASLKIKVAYDSNLITLNSVKYNTDMGGNAQEPQKLTSPVTLNWFNGATNYNGDCVFATLTFTALDSITESKTTSFTITYNDNDIYNIDEDNLGLTLDLGEIEIDPAIESLITYNANGGSKEPASQTKKYKQDIKLSDVIPEREEYTFLGWAVSSDETTPVYQPGDVYSDDHDLVLYAVWEKVSHVHDYHAVITDPTCTEKGYTTYTCSCGDSYVGNYTSELGHDYDAWMSVSDTQHRGVCKHDSSHVLVENHVWNDGVVTTEATCTEKGVMTYTCSICGDTYNVDIPVKGHSYGIWIPNDNGSHTRICENNKNHKETANCEYEYKVVTAATYTKEGTGSFTCKYCGVSGNLFSRNPGN